jgi:hypothetical protein
MKRIEVFIGFLVVLALLLPGLSAQDEKKKDVEKTDKKEADPDKKKKEPEPKKEKLASQDPFYAKILSIKGDSNRDLTIERPVRDDRKVQEVANWSAQRQQQLAQQYSQAVQQRDFKARANQLANYNRDLANYQQELAKRSANTFSPKSFEVRAAETAKVRSMIPPIEFDDQGFQKKWTKKELEALKDKTGLPGHYPVEFDTLKSGQYVQIYMAKVAPPKKKKGPDDDDPPVMKIQEYVLIVITGEAK